MEFEAPGTVRVTPSRHEKSLGLLTMKFLGLLQEAKDGVLDLNVVSDRERGGHTAGSGPLFQGGIHCVYPRGATRREQRGQRQPVRCCDLF